MAFNIRSLKPNPRSKHQQGYYNISECRKFKGSAPPIYRSSWEKQFMAYLERNPEISAWSSEAFSIPYVGIDGRPHSYFPDFLIKMVNGSTIIAEVKPKFQLVPPAPPKNRGPVTARRYARDVETYQTNMLKIAAARMFATSRGMKYLLVTEDFFKPTMG